MSLDLSQSSSQVGQATMRIKHFYLSRAPIPVLSGLIETFIEKHGMSSSFQELLLSETINCRIGSARPASLKYRLAFCKKLINILEDHQIEIIDNVYYNYTNLLNLKPEVDFSYTTFVIKGKEITIRDTDSLVQDGTTGLYSWEAGKEFISYSLENEALFKDKVILELGSGTGITGVAICQLIGPRKYYFTDFSPKVLSNLEKTTEENYILQSHVIPFDWEREDDKCLLEKIKPQLIIGCDLVYDPSNLDDLLSVIKRSNQLLIPMVFLFTDRRTDVLSKFEDGLDKIEHLNVQIKNRTKDEDSFYYTQIPNLTFRLYLLSNSSSDNRDSNETQATTTR